MENKLKNLWVLKLILLVMIEPACFKLIPSVHRVFLIGGMILTLVYLVMNIAKNKVDSTFMWIAIFFLTMLLVTLLKSNYLYELLREYFSQIGLCFIFYYYLKTNPERLIAATSVWDIYLFINLITLIAFPNGLVRDVSERQMVWFLGGKNPQIRLILPIMSFSLIRTNWQKRGLKIYNVIVVLVSVVSMYVNSSGTGLIGITVYLLLLLFLLNYRHKSVPNWFTLNKLSLGVLGLNVAVVFFEMQYMFSFIIENLLGKSLTLTGRTAVWTRALNYIYRSPYVGNGYFNADACRSILYVSHPHNYIMYIMMMGGVLLLSEVVIGITMMSKKLEGRRNEFPSKIVLITVITFLFMGIDESLTSAPLLYPLFVTGMLINKIIEMDAYDDVQKSKKKVRFLL